MAINSAAVECTIPDSDICLVYDRSAIVTGFFTPDYAVLASALSRNLAKYRISHHLYARIKIAGGWGSQTLQKPSTLAAAIRDYPSSVLILLDVDCLIRGNISELSGAKGDVMLRLKRKATKQGVALMPCSRVIVVRPTPGGVSFVSAWQKACEQLGPKGTDENALIDVVEHNAGAFSIAALPQRFVGQELRDARTDDVIVHQSAHDPTRPMWALRKEIQKRFRMLRNASFKVFTGQGYTRWR
jgi:Nucleotide-diphospho-sugar transferase